MATDSLLVYIIILLGIGYSQLVVSTSELETLFSCVNKLGTDSSSPGTFTITTWPVVDSQDITGLRLIKCTGYIVTWN